MLNKSVEVRPHVDAFLWPSGKHTHRVLAGAFDENKTHTGVESFSEEREREYQTKTLLSVSRRFRS